MFPARKIRTTISSRIEQDPTDTGVLSPGPTMFVATSRVAQSTSLSVLLSFIRLTRRKVWIPTQLTASYDDNNRHNQTNMIMVMEKRDQPTQKTAVQQVSKPRVTVRDLPGPRSCGKSGNFTLGFDDTVMRENDNSLMVANGLKNPYHHLFFANGFTHVPDQWEPYPAASPPNVALFLPLTGPFLPHPPFAGALLPGELGAGPRASVSAYRFNAYSGYFGCVLNSLTPCTLRISGYRYDGALRREVVVAEQNETIGACWGYVNCQLRQVFFTEQFRGLSGMQFNMYSYHLDTPQMYMMDDLQLEWYNNTCPASLMRIGHW